MGESLRELFIEQMTGWIVLESDFKIKCEIERNKSQTKHIPTRLTNLGDKDRAPFLTTFCINDVNTSNGMFWGVKTCSAEEREVAVNQTHVPMESDAATNNVVPM